MHLFHGLPILIYLVPRSLWLSTGILGFKPALAHSWHLSVTCRLLHTAFLDYCNWFRTKQLVSPRRSCISILTWQEIMAWTPLNTASKSQLEIPKNQSIQLLVALWWLTSIRRQFFRVKMEFCNKINSKRTYRHIVVLAILSSGRSTTILIT